MIDDEATSLINNQDADAYGTASTSGNDAGERENGIGKGEIKQIGKYFLSLQHMKGMRKLATNPNHRPNHAHRKCQHQQDDR
jgi:hypothetical protein